MVPDPKAVRQVSRLGALWSVRPIPAARCVEFAGGLPKTRPDSAGARAGLECAKRAGLH